MARAGAALRSWAAALAVLLAAGAARAEPAGADQPDSGREVAVLVFRSGAAELPDIDASLAELLRARTSLEVQDTDDARRRYGGSLDGDVVDCAGKAACIARIGRALGADEVLLAGISRFGDVILTLQRIDTRKGAVRARIAEALAPGAAPDSEALLAYLRRVMPRSDFLRFGVIRIQANIAGAAVTIGGKPRGLTPIEPVQVPAPERYDIRITRDGYVPFSAETSVPPGSEVVVRATLMERETAWYKRWWVWTLVGVAAAGTAAAVYATYEQDVAVTIRF